MRHENTSIGKTIVDRLEVKALIFGGDPKNGVAGEELVAATQLTDVTASAAELNVLDGVTAGTVTASKGVVVDASKKVDVWDPTTLKIGGTSVTATATELNLIDGSIAGTAVASKALVVDANKRVDTLDVTALLVGGVAVTSSAAELNIVDGVLATAAELNKCDGIPATAYQEVAEERSFTETTGAGTYTATVAIPAGATYDVEIRNVALWTATTSAELTAGDGDDADGICAAIDLKTAPAVDVAGAGGIIMSDNAAAFGAYQGFKKYCAAAKTVTLTVVTVGAAGDAGRTRVIVRYSTPTAVAATKV